MHLGLAVAVVFLALIPVVAVAYAWRATRSKRLALALAAFVVLEIRLIALLAIHTVVSVDHFVEEMITFGGDLAVIAAFALAFMHGTRWWRAEPRGQPA